MLSLHYNGSNSFLFVIVAKMYQFKAKGSEIKPYKLCLGNNSKDFTIDNMKRTGLKGVVKVFSIDYNVIDTSNILFGFVKKLFVGLLTLIRLGFLRVVFPRGRGSHLTPPPPFPSCLHISRRAYLISI